MVLRFAGGPSPFSARLRPESYGRRSAFQRLDRPPQRTHRDEELSLGFVHRGDDVFALRPEERLGDSGNSVTLSFDGVGDHVEFGSGG